jgi:hypothetical protein
MVFDLKPLQTSPKGRLKNHSIPEAIPLGLNIFSFRTISKNKFNIKNERGSVREATPPVQH